MPQRASATDSRLLCCDESDSSRRKFSRILRSLQISPMARNVPFVVRSACVPQWSQTNWILSFPPATSANRTCIGARQLGQTKWRKNDGRERLCRCGIEFPPRGTGSCPRRCYENNNLGERWFRSSQAFARHPTMAVLPCLKREAFRHVSPRADTVYPCGVPS
jgi:hypothetical protein